jgi:N-acylneuraminate cytidylyltransferase
VTPDSGVFCVIPARAGSTRVADKNVRTVGGVTLLERAIATALAVTPHAYVSTDSERYASIALAAGAHVPELRPRALAGAHANVDDALRHAYTWCPDQCDVVVLMQATSPFTTADDLIGVVHAVRRRPVDTAFTATRLPATNVFAYVSDDDGVAQLLTTRFLGARTQDVPALGVPTGAAYATPASRIAAGDPLVGTSVGLVWVDDARAVDIDDEADLQRADALAASFDRVGVGS